MGANVRDIKVRMKAVGNIRRITKTMQMIATARFQAAQRKTTATRPYSRKIAELVAELSGVSGKVEHPLLSPPEQKTGRQLLLVLTSNRGLCGGFNAHIVRAAKAAVKADPGTQWDVEVVGKKGLAVLRYAGYELNFLKDFEDQPSYVPVEKLAERYMDAFRAGRYDAVKVVYMSFASMSRQVPEVLQLLPMAAPKAATAPGANLPGAGANLPGAGLPGGEVEYEYSPDAVSLLNELLPITVKVRLFQCFNENFVSEQLARMVAMKQATDAAGKLVKSLTRQYNRARQTQITTELSEIIGGAAALG